MPSYPNRCQHIKVNGTQCGSPALRRNRFCYFHKRHHDERIQLNTDRQKNDRQKTVCSRRCVAIDLPVFEDANSVQITLMQITRLLIAGDIDTKTAGLVLYALQTASCNLSRTRFEPNMRDVILDPARVGEIALGAQAWKDSDFPSDDDEEEDDGIDPDRRAGILKAAEFLYELDREKGGINGFAPKPSRVEAANSAKPKPAKSASASSSTNDPELAQIREQIVAKIKKAVPALIAANPSLLTPSPADSPGS
jgi:hypothetical protein